MAGRLTGKVAIITGSGQGIGRDVALCMAEEGARVITNNRKPELLQRRVQAQLNNEKEKSIGS